MNRADIERAAESMGYPIAEWRETLNGDTAFFEGEFAVAADDEERFLYAGDEGHLEATIVGSAELGNERIFWTFVQEGNDDGDGIEVRPLTDLEVL